MISVIITAYKEADTLGAALQVFIDQVPTNYEILVVCPDPETTEVVRQYALIDPKIAHVPELERKGKPHALNLGLAVAKGDIVILSDGDVVIGENVLQPLLAPFAEDEVGAVTGRPISINSKDNKLGYWSQLLVAAAHETRMKRAEAKQFLLCSGYLFAFRRRLIPYVPEDALAEDGVISHRIAQQGYQIRYAPEAEVFVKYPTTYADWQRQKVRSAGGYTQKYIVDSPYRMRSARLEVLEGTRFALRFARTALEYGWTLQLFVARAYLWLQVFWLVWIRKRPLTELWQRVETTK